jgi:uncharacterized protein GlcG (DUF336 family)
VVAAERRARQISVSMFIAVVNDCSVIKMSSRMDGNSPGQRHRGPPKTVPANTFRTPPPRGPRRAGDPTQLAQIMGAGFRLAEPSGDASKKPSQPSGGKQ